MNINRIADLASLNQNTLTKSTEVESSGRANSAIASDNSDKFVRSELAYTSAYTKNLKQKDEDVGRIKQGNVHYFNEQDNNFKRLVHSLLGKQNTSKMPVPLNELDIPSAEMLDIISGAGLVDGIPESDYDDSWSSTNVAKRIVKFAKAISDGDSSKIALLKDAFIKGFAETEKVFGGEGSLEDISYETYDEVMKLFDEWESEEVESTEESASPDESTPSEETTETDA